MTRPIPSEFVGFVRATGMRSFDRLALRATSLDVPLRTFVKSWSRLSDADKEALFDELIAAVTVPEVQDDNLLPALKHKKPVRRYDPDEVAATLPRKPAVRKPATKKKAKKKRAE